jgi:hypothetical protein
VRRRISSVLAGCLLLAGVLAGCTSARSNLGTTDDSCYLALPAATHAVGAHARFLGVHLFTMSALHQHAPHLYNALATSHASSERVCVVAFEGHFTTSSVAHPRGRTSGRLAVVVARTPSNQLLGTVIFSHAPLRFGHSHIF